MDPKYESTDLRGSFDNFDLGNGGGGGRGVAYYILEILSCFLSVVKPAPEASKCIRWVHRNNNMNSGNNTLNLPAILF